MSHPGRMRRGLVSLAAVLAVVLPAADRARAGQTNAQQACVNDMNKFGAGVAKSQNPRTAGTGPTTAMAA